MKQPPGIEVLKSFFDYEPDSGRLVWKVARRSAGAKVAPGVAAGSINGGGYLELKVAGYRTYVHRVVWALHYGMWPDGVVDHRDGDRQNNRVGNLRRVPQKVNCENQRKPRKDNLLGVLGVSRKKNRFQAFIQQDGKRKFLGSYLTADEAHAAYVEAKRTLHTGCTL